MAWAQARRGIIDPNGVTRASSLSINSIYERARATGTIQPGQWTIQIRGFRTWASNRTVYWSALGLALECLRLVVRQIQSVLGRRQLNG